MAVKEQGKLVLYKKIGYPSQWLGLFHQDSFLACQWRLSWKKWVRGLLCRVPRQTENKNIQWFIKYHKFFFNK